MVTYAINLFEIHFLHLSQECGSARLVLDSFQGEQQVLLFVPKYRVNQLGKVTVQPLF